MYWPQFIPTGRRKGGEREVGRLYRQPEKSPNLIHMLHIPIQKGRGEVKTEIHGVLLLMIWVGGAVPQIEGDNYDDPGSDAQDGDAHDEEVGRLFS